MKEQLVKVTESITAELVAKGAPAELVNAIAQASNAMIESLGNYRNDTLKGNLNEMWFCEFAPKYTGKSLFRSAFSTIQARA